MGWGGGGGGAGGGGGWEDGGGGAGHLGALSGTVRGEMKQRSGRRMVLRSLGFYWLEDEW